MSCFAIVCCDNINECQSGKNGDAEIAAVLIANSIDRIPKDVIDEFARVAATRVRHYSDSLNLEGTERVSAKRLMDRLRPHFL